MERIEKGIKQMNDEVRELTEFVSTEIDKIVNIDNTPNRIYLRVLTSLKILEDYKKLLETRITQDTMDFSESIMEHFTVESNFNIGE